MNTINQSFESRLTDIVVKIEKSGWTDEDKEAMYAKISEYLHESVLPIILQHAPSEEVKAMAADASKATVDSYIELMKKPLSDPKLYEELNTATQEVLDDIETALSKGGIA